MLRLLNPDPGRRCLCVTIPLDDQTSIRFRFLGLLGVPLCPHPGTMAKAVQTLSAAGFYFCSVLLAPCWASRIPVRAVRATVPLDDPTRLRFRFLGLLGLERLKHTALAQTGGRYGSRIPSAILQAQVKPWYRTGWCFSSARLLGKTSGSRRRGYAEAPAYTPPAAPDRRQARERRKKLHTRLWDAV